MKKRKWSRNASICGHRIKLFQRGKGCWWGDKVSNNEFIREEEEEREEKKVKVYSCIYFFAWATIEVLLYSWE